MKKLFIGPVDSTFLIERDVVLSPWSFLEAEDLYPGWEFIDFVNPLHDTDKQFEESRQLFKLSSKLVCEYADKLNARFNRNYSDGYWHILLYPWVMSTLMATRIRYLELEQAVNTYSDDNLQIDVLLTDMDWAFNSYREHMNNGVLDPVFNWWLNSVILQKLGPSNWNRTVVKAPQLTRQQNATMQNKNISGDVATVKTSILPYCLFERPAISMNAGIGKLSRLLLSSIAHVCSLLNKQHIDTGKIFFSSIDSSPSDLQPGFEHVVREVLKKTMPLAYTDRYIQLDQQAANKTYFPGRINISAPGNFVDSGENQFELAHAFEAGERIVYHQHGSKHGQAETFCLPSGREYTMHAFLSWGWTKHDKYIDNAIPVASPYLKSHINTKYRTDTQSENIVFIGNAMLATSGRLNSDPASTDVLHYRQDKIKFIGTLSDNIRDTLLYRQDSRTPGCFSDYEYIRKTYPHIQELSGKLEPKLAGFNLVVLDYPSTLLSVLLVADVPVVCFWNPDHRPMCETAKKIFAKLKHSNILFSDPESAATHINTIWSNIDDWWQSTEVRAARSEWLQNYGHTRKLWWLDWIPVIIRLSMGPRVIARFR